MSACSLATSRSGIEALQEAYGSEHGARERTCERPDLDAPGRGRESVALIRSTKSPITTIVTLSIQDVLNRRSDLSTFLVHLTRERVAGVTARANLESIVRERRLRALTPLGWGKKQDNPVVLAEQSQRVVCFSETPLEHVYSLFAETQGRSISLQPYGFALTKIVARKMGVQPVWYVDMTTNGGREWEEARALDRLRDDAVEAGGFHTSPLAKLLPFYEQMGVWPNNRKEFLVGA